MDILNVYSLKIPDIKIIKYGRFPDKRGYFSESLRLSDIHNKLQQNFKVLQINESFSKRNTLRGLHFQWNPFMGKLVRTIKGNMVDIVLDIRKGSPYFGKALLHNMGTSHKRENNEWIWVPPGFAHGNYFTEDTYIEYLCTGEYNPKSEASISPLAHDIDWSLSNKTLLTEFAHISKSTKLITDKDKDGYSVLDWQKTLDSKNFIYSNL